MSLLSTAKTAAAKLATILNTYPWFAGMDIGPTGDGKEIVLLLFVKFDPPLFQKHMIPKVYENFQVLTINETNETT